jgi:hypothetical protein
MTNKPTTTRSYTLFIDESGRFGENDLAEERHEGTPSSQICGILLPGTYHHQKRGRDLPPAILELFPLNQQDHAVDVPHAERAAMIERVVKLCEQRDWRLTRLVNNSGIGEGEVAVTYTRMVAELIVCLYQTLREEEPDCYPIIHLTYAQVMLGKRIEGRDYYFSRGEVTPTLRYQGKPIMIEPLEYAEAIKREMMIDLKHGMGISEDEAKLALGKLRSASARIHPALRLSDLVSNCTYRRGRALRNFGSVRAHLLDAIELYDYELHPLKSVHLAEDLARHRALGQAVILVIDYLTHRRQSPEAQDRLRETLHELIEDLVKEHSAERASDLRAMLDAVEDWVYRQRNYSVAEDLIKVLQDEVFPPLQSALSLRGEEEEVIWARFRLLNLALANANNNGRLELARQRRDALEAMRGQVNHRWEELSTIMLSQLNIASSCTNTLDLEHGLKIAEEVRGFYQDLTEMLGAFRGESLISSQVRVHKHGYALNIMLMLERYICLERIAKGEVITQQFDRGRSLGQEALSTLSSIEDRTRIYQQLAHLEALAGDFDRAWYEMWCGIKGVDHQSTALETHTKSSEIIDRDMMRLACLDALEGLSDLEIRFPIFHIIRLALMELKHTGNTERFKHFERRLLALTRDQARSILEGRVDDQPAHAILRVWSAFTARLGEESAAVGALRTLCRLIDEYGGGDALHIVTLSAMVETAIGLFESGSEDVGLKIVSHTAQKRSSRTRKKRDVWSFRDRLQWVYVQVGDVPRLLVWLDELKDQCEAWVAQPQDDERRLSLYHHSMRYPG